MIEKIKNAVKFIWAYAIDFILLDAAILLSMGLVLISPHYADEYPLATQMFDTLAYFVVCGAMFVLGYRCGKDKD